MNLKEFFPKDKVLFEITKGVAYTLLPTLIFFIFPAIKVRIYLYDTAFLICAFVCFIALLIYDVFFKVKNKYENASWVISLYAFTVVVFFCITNWANDTIVKGHLPILFVFIILLISKVIYFTKVNYDYLHEKQVKKNVGFATTGVLINIANINDPTIIIVFNKNLRAGKGLWVPPGGHFEPYNEKADEKLKIKISQEIGVTCEIFNPFKYSMALKSEDLDTNEVSWLTPPIFFLKENLMGKCSQDHEIHIDLIYICITDGRLHEKNHKYDSKNRVEIPLKRCINSFEEAENTVYGIIDKWHLSFGSKPSTRQDISKDVVWRIHLTAKIFNEFYEK